MIRRLLPLPALLTAGWLIGGCAALPAAPDAPVVPAEEAAERRCAAAFVGALRRRDFSPLNGMLSGAMAREFTPERFAQFLNGLDRLGELEDAQELTGLELPLFRARVWKLTFRRTAADGAVYRHQKLLHLTVGAPEGRRQLLGISIQ